MALVDKACMQSQVTAIRDRAECGDLGEVRLQLTSMLRCAGHLGCEKAVPCSDQAVQLLRDLVLPDGARPTGKAP